MSLVLILRVFCIRRVYRGSFFSLVLILCICAYLGIKGDQFFQHTNWCTTICITCPILCDIVQFLCEIECIKFVCNEFVLVVVQIDLIQKNTNSLHSNLIHSILSKIGHVIHIVVHRFVLKTRAEKNPKSEKKYPPLSPGMREYVVSVLRRKKTIPYKPYVHKKRVESMLGTCKNMTKKYSIWIIWSHTVYV